MFVIVSGMILSSTVFAATATTTASGRTEVVACVASAVSVRESAMQSAFTSFSGSMTAAFSKRAADLSSAWALTDKTARTNAIKAVGSAFKESSAASKKTYNAARVAAWNQFSTSRKACKAPATGENQDLDIIQ